MKSVKNALYNIVRSIKTSWAVVWRANGALVILYFLLELVNATLPLLQVYFLNLLIDFLMSKNLESIIFTALLWAAAIILSQALGAVSGYLKTRIDKRSYRKFDDAIYGKMAKMPLGIFDTAEGRDMCEMATYCGGIVCDEIPFGIFTVVKEIYTFAVSIAVLLRFNVPFVLLYLLFTLPGIVTLAKLPQL